MEYEIMQYSKVGQPIRVGAYKYKILEIIEWCICFKLNPFINKEFFNWSIEESEKNEKTAV